MPNIATVLKDEIRRLAKKEAKLQLSELRAATTRHRKDIASLKRTLSQQERLIQRLQKGAGAPRKSTAAAATSDGPEVRFSPAWVKNHRAKLELSAADYAALIGVSPLTVYNWEKGRSRPQKRQLLAWSKVRQLGKREAWKALEELE